MQLKQKRMKSAGSVSNADTVFLQILYERKF